MSNGIDLSHWQTEVDYDNLREHGIQFAYVKASQGWNVVDPGADTHWAGCVAAGIVPGFYHFAVPTETPESNAYIFARMVKHHESSIGMLPPCLDFELPGADDDVMWIQKFWETYDSVMPFRPKMLYANANWFEHNDLGGVNPEMYTWVASWGTMIGHPSWHDGRTAIHQYTNVGTIPGVVGEVDLDYAIRTLALLVLH